MIADLNKPLDKMKADVVVVRSSMQATVENLQSKLEKRAQLREKKSLLQLFLSIHESVGKVEALIGIESMAGSMDRPGTDQETAVPNAVDGAEGEVSAAGEKGPQLDIKMMERVAIEFNQLQFLVNRGKGLPFVQNLEPRIQKVQETLQTGMRKALEGALDAFFQDRNSTAAVASLTSCLRTYALIDRTLMAEEAIRTALYEPFLTKLVTSSSLNFDPLLPMGVKPLQYLFKKILDFTAQEFLPLQEITERTLKGTSYQMLTNVVWVAVAASIQQNLSSIFSPGIPDVFHENFTITMDFLEKLEATAPDAKALRYLRSHPSYGEFMRRWQAPVYFQIRFTAISSAFEDQVGPVTPETITACLDSPETLDVSDGRLLLPISRALMEAVSTSWADNVWLYTLSSRFWKLTLQCIGRYALWLRTVTEPYRRQDGSSSQPRSPSVVDGQSGASNAATSSVSPSFLTADASDDEEQMVLNVLSILSYEVRTLSAKLRAFYSSTILPKLPAGAMANEIIESRYWVGVFAAAGWFTPVPVRFVPRGH